MNENELKQKFSTLKQESTPRQEWVFSLRQEIMGVGHQESRTSSRISVLISQIVQVVAFIRRPVAFAPLMALFILGGVGYAASDSLPGDTLYPIKASKERLQLALVSDGEKSEMYMDLAQKRLEDLRLIAQANKLKNLNPTIEAFQGNVSEVSRGFAQLVEEEPDRALQATREVVELHNGTEAVEAILGTQIDEEESHDFWLATSTLIEHEIADLQERSLTLEQNELLQEAKAAFEQEDYVVALEIIWELSSQTTEETSKTNDENGSSQ